MVVGWSDDVMEWCNDAIMVSSNGVVGWSDDVMEWCNDGVMI